MLARMVTPVTRVRVCVDYDMAVRRKLEAEDK